MLIPIMLASLFVSSVSFVGAIVLALKRTWTPAWQTTLVSFAAGVMLSAAVLDLMPEALEEAGEANIFPAIFVGIITFFFLERFVLWFHHHHEGHGAHPTSILVLLGDGIHNLIDGVAIAAAFLISPGVGVVTTLAIAAHEIPQEIADFGVLVSSGMSKVRALIFNFLSGLTALLGALLAYFFLETAQGLVWMALAFSAGMFLYISCSDLIPELHTDFSKHRRFAQTIPFLLGILILWTTVKLLEG